MNGVPKIFDPSEKLECESIATAMFSSNSPEELLKIFLTSLGDRLNVSRVAVYQLTSQDQGIVLVEAISPNIQKIKNQIYPISYFGVNSLQNYPRNRVVPLSDIVQTPATLRIHQCWLDTQLKAMMSAPILFNSLTTFDQIWGLAFVQQCDRTRLWQPQEACFLFELSQVLSQCLQSWELSLRSPTFSQSSLADKQICEEANEQEEFIATRMNLSEDLEIKPVQTDLLAVFNDFVLSDDEENEILDRSRIKDSKSAINHAINLAMQKLDQKVQYRSSPYPRVFTEINTPQDVYGVDLESSTIEDILESCTQDKQQEQTCSKVEYLQQRIGDLIESMQQKMDEIALLQQQVQELTASQQEFRQMLLDLQSENLTQNIKAAIIEMYQSLLDKP